MAVLLPDGTREVSLSKKQFSELQSVLGRFSREIKCPAAMLVDESGMIVAQSGSFTREQMTPFAALAAGNYSATAEMARLLGEDGGFKVEFHEGEKNSVYLKGISEGFILVVVFSKHTTFGMVRVLAAKTIDELTPILSSVGEAQLRSEPVSQNREFTEQLQARLDAVLGGK